MAEKKIELESIDPVSFYGVNESRIEKIRNYFPKIKMIARGNEIKIIGETDEVDRFTERLELIKNHFLKYNNITDDDLEMILGGDILLQEVKPDDDKTILYGITGKPIKPRSQNQTALIDAYAKTDMVFAVGPAGTGKTYLAIALAVKALKNKEVKRIILSRPAVEAGEKLGFLPGDMKEKLDPYMQALYDALHDMIPAKKLETMIEDRMIQIAPLAFMRGRTLSNAVVILDEAQNATISQIKMFLTRMGENSKFIITGDITQIDLPSRTDSGLIHATRILRDIKDISFVYFNQSDVVRHALVKKIINAYEKE